MLCYLNIDSYTCVGHQDIWRNADIKRGPNSDLFIHASVQHLKCKEVPNRNFQVSISWSDSCSFSLLLSFALEFCSSTLLKWFVSVFLLSLDSGTSQDYLKKLCRNSTVDPQLCMLFLPPNILFNSQQSL